MIWIVLLVVWIALVAVAYAMAKKAKETQWLLFTGLCCVPIAGPIIVIYAYVLNNTIMNEYTKRSEVPKDSKE